MVVKIRESNLPSLIHALHTIIFRSCGITNFLLALVE